MKQWINDINTGDLDERYVAIMNHCTDVEATIPEEEREKYYGDLRDSMEIRRKGWEHTKKRKKFLGLF